MIALIGGLAALTAIVATLIHALNRGVRQQLVVANPELYTDNARPRFTLLRLTQRGLLLARLLLLLVAALIAAVTDVAPPSATRVANTSVAVVPGTARAQVAAQIAADANAVWLDSALTPFSAVPQSSFEPAALRILDANMPAQRSLTVLGQLPADRWPRHGFAMTRDVNWIPVDGTPTPAQQTAVIRPTVVVAAPVAWQAALRDATAVWQQAGVVTDVRVVAPDGVSAADDEWLLLPAGADRPERPVHAVTATVAFDALDRQWDASQLASTLWLALAAQAADMPSSNAGVAGAAFVRVPYVAQQLERQQQRAVPVVWMWLLLGALVIERALAARVRT
ncbi:MAG: hypothetical protein AAFO81_12640 [Pseudomonadota bacterium]